MTTTSPDVFETVKYRREPGVRLFPHPGQERAWDSRARFVFIIAGHQSGKTSFGPHWLLREIERKETRAQRGAQGLALSYRLTPRADLRAPGVSVTVELPADVWRGGAWSTGADAGTFPSTFGDAPLFRGPAGRITLARPGGRRLTISLPKPAEVLLVDNRRWFRPQTFTLRLDPAEALLAPPPSAANGTSGSADQHRCRQLADEFEVVRPETARPKPLLNLH